MNETQKNVHKHFINSAIEQDLASGRYAKVKTRFPPEPNGFLHIGHAKSICLNFGLAREYRAVCHLRFDDTNPEKEEDLYIQSIQRDVKWLGFDWGEHLYFASDYFDKLYECALTLIDKGLAYVCDLTPDQIREYRGTLKEPGRNSPYRDRSVEENRSLFEQMREGAFPESPRVLRAKIDMASPNINMRDPILYRSVNAPHPRTGSIWKIYPMYDFTHPISDAIEGISHSLCTLEFEDHRPLYDWILKHAGKWEKLPRQIEFARLNLNYMVLSKRKLLQLVRDKHVEGWDDPRMPSLSGLRRRGFTPESIREFCTRIGIAKRDSQVDWALLEFCLREELNRTASRVMAVLRPLKVVLVNYPEDQEEEMEAVNNPEDPSQGNRRVPFSRELYIEREDFMEDPPKKFFRLAPGREVRLRYGYFITCEKAVKDPETGDIKELHCTYDPQTRGGTSPDGRKVKSTIHWVSARHAVKASVRLYNHLFTEANPSSVPEGKDFTHNLNPQSLETLEDCRLEPGLGDAPAGLRFQFERLGYFWRDPEEVRKAKDKLVFNRIVTLKDPWAKLQKRQPQQN